MTQKLNLLHVRSVSNGPLQLFSDPGWRSREIISFKFMTENRISTYLTVPEKRLSFWGSQFLRPICNSTVSRNFFFSSFECFRTAFTHSQRVSLDTLDLKQNAILLFSTYYIGKKQYRLNVQCFVNKKNKYRKILLGKHNNFCY